MNEQINRIKTLMGLKENFSKTMRTMRGLEPNIETVAIISPENPCGEGLSDEENKIRSKEFIRYLRDAAFSYRKIKGKYGVPENSYIVNNITKKDALQIGGDFEQDTIIFGFKNPEKEGMTFQMITSYKCSEDSSVGEVIAERDVFQTLEKGAEDYYSEVKGRKFIIPFFDDDYFESEWSGGAIGKKSLPEETQAKLKRLIAESLDEDKTSKYRWTRRGVIQNILLDRND